QQQGAVEGVEIDQAVGDGDDLGDAVEGLLVPLAGVGTGAAEVGVGVVTPAGPAGGLVLPQVGADIPRVDVVGQQLGDKVVVEVADHGDDHRPGGPDHLARVEPGAGHAVVDL